MNPSYSPASFFTDDSSHSEASNVAYSGQFITPNDTQVPLSDRVGSDEMHADRLRIHARIEKERRKMFDKHMRELSSFATDCSNSRSPRFTQLVLLQIAADLLDKINIRHQNDLILPSYLTTDEINFLNLEASNAFLFVTTIESSIFRIIHVADSIYRVLHLTPEQWLNQDLFSFIHPDDLFDVQNQLISLTNQLGKKSSIKCRLNQGNGLYTSVIIDGTIKKVDQTLKPILTNESGSYAFIGICHLPLTSQYNAINMTLYKNFQSLIFSCRCSPNDWKIFLVDRSITTFPSISFNTFCDKSILDFIHIDDQSSVHQALSNATITLEDDLIACHLIYSPTEILTMILDIKPFFNPSSQRTDFIELTFKNITDLVKTSDEGC